VQTRETLRPYLLEEVFELDHALSEGDAAAIREEVADLLLHLAWQLVIAEEQEEFSPEEVADDLERKMRRRHPHLFELGRAEKWETLKRKERKQAAMRREGVLSHLPPALPSLLMAYRLQERAASVGFDWPDVEGPLEKVREELAEVRAELRIAPMTNDGPAEPSGEPVHPAPPDELTDEIGDLFFAMVNLARKARVQPMLALDRANRKFRRRFEELERLAGLRGIDVGTAGLPVLDALWNEVKRGEP
jgi:MazG family protein